MKTTTLQTTVLAAAIVLLAGCSTTKLDADVPKSTLASTSSGAGAGSGNAGAAPQSLVAPVDLTKQQGVDNVAFTSLPKVVYFDFDSFVVKDEFRNVVEGNAKALMADKTRKVSIEGHTDERGGREYNLALGQKRAEAVAKSLALLGANTAQMEAVSFGKERPAVQGSDEAAWAKNRRAELVSR